MEIRCNISSVGFGISEAKHGLHVHTFGILNPSENDTISKFLLHKNIFFVIYFFAGCGSSGSHFNPFGLTHGNVSDTIKHLGDYGNVKSENGQIVQIFNDYMSKLSGKFSIIGRTIVLHKLEDDLGLGNNSESKLTGNSGSRIACGVIGLSERKIK